MRKEAMYSVLILAVSGAGAGPRRSVHKPVAKKVAIHRPAPETEAARLTRTLMLRAKYLIDLYTVPKKGPPWDTYGHGNEWHPMANGLMLIPGSLGFDIQRTNSVITPFFGTVRLQYKDMEAPLFPAYPTEEAARNGELTDIYFVTRQLNFAYQDGHWVYKGSVLLRKGTEPE